ncbi:MAG TPA: winged helix-turn-helix domain-containing protein [Sphingomicrobium sp.]|nr:winged helix-turn-helix domain-containing protein [Sphingomicrobium sp.]
MRGLAGLADFRLGQLLVSPSRRLVEGPGGARHLQPQVMLVFLCLARREGEVVTRRELFETCWGGAPVGDDSLNRALSAIRHMLDAVGAHATTLETVPRTGYRLVASTAAASELSEQRARAVEAAFDCWRSGEPKPDVAEIVAIENVLAGSAGDPREWGILALLMRKAAEYADAEECGSYVARCEEAARRALAQDKQPHALVALAGLMPLFGNWVNARTQLLEILSDHPHNIPARHDLAVLEMATGRPRAAVPLIAHLIAEDGLAATFHYKRMYHLWTLGDVQGAEQVAARALQLWPRHPAIWSARFWILIFTRRAEQALRLILDQSWRPPISHAAAEFLRSTAEIAAAFQANRISQLDIDRHVARTIEVAALGPAQAVAALQTLYALDAIDEAFAVARGYYLGQGKSAAPLRWNANDPSITDQHRRVTQLLFTPAANRMREDDRFLPLCEDMGLASYWDAFGLVPDFLQGSTTAPPIVRE